MLSQNKKLRTLVPDQVVRGWGGNLGGLQIQFHVTVARKTGKKNYRSYKGLDSRSHKNNNSK